MYTVHHHNSIVWLNPKKNQVPQRRIGSVQKKWNLRDRIESERREGLVDYFSFLQQTQC